MNNIIEKINLKNSLLNDFSEMGELLAAGPGEKQIEALATFQRLGLPDRKNEEWKYTNIAKSFEEHYQTTLPSSKFRTSATDAKNFLIARNECTVVVLENGKFNPELSDDLSALSGYTIVNLASQSNQALVNKYFAHIANSSDEPLVALNTAFGFDGVFIIIPDNCIVEKPIQILHITNSINENTIAHPRVLVVAGTGSKATIIENYRSLNGDHSGFANCVTEILVKENASIAYNKVQLEEYSNTHVNFTQVIQENNSTFDIATITLGGGLVRNNLHIKLTGTHCTSHLFGLYILDGKQLVDNHTLVDHTMPDCFSNELYKGVLDDHSTGVFNGKVFVRQDAQKTNAYQSNKNILLSDDAQMNTKPQLEIFADDVKCTHGATIGQLDEEALFYLRARGIGESNARALLNIAFASDVLNNIKQETLRNELQELAIAKLKKHENG